MMKKMNSQTKDPKNQADPSKKTGKRTSTSINTTSAKGIIKIIEEETGGRMIVDTEGIKDITTAVKETTTREEESIIKVGNKRKDRTLVKEIFDLLTV